MSVILKKLSFKTSGAENSLVIMGAAHSLKRGQTQYGDFVGFRGEFRGFADGNMNAPLTSFVAFLPDVATDMLVAALEGADGAAVQFAFRISRVPSEKSTTGYEYIVEPLTENKSSLDALAEQVTAKLAALPAPTVPETPAKGKKTK